jgi:hypothetical protein
MQAQVHDEAHSPHSLQPESLLLRLHRHPHPPW